MSTRVSGAPEFISLSILRDGEVDESEWIAVSDPVPEQRRPCERLFKLRRASKPQPGDVFLVLGDLEGEGEVRFEDLAEVTWCSDRVFDSDLCYRPVRWK